MVLVPGIASPDDIILTGNADRAGSTAWSITGLTSEFRLTDAGLGGDIRVGRITLQESGQSFDDIQVTCTRFVATTHGVSCSDATYRATIPFIGRQNVRGAFDWNKHSATTRVVLRDVAVAGSRMRVEVVATDSGIVASYSGNAFQVESLIRLATEFSDALSGFSGDGQTALTGRVVMPAAGPLRISVAADLDAASLANDAGTIVAAGVTGDFSADIVMQGESTRFDLALDSQQGEGYLEPVYANFSEHALRLRARDVHTMDFASFEVGGFDLQQGTLLDASGSARIQFPPDEETPLGLTMDVTLRDSSVENLYTSLIRVQLAGTVLGALDTDGRVSGRVRMTDNALRSAVLQLDDVILDDRLGRFAIYGLDGTVNWQVDPSSAPQPSRLSWKSGTVYNLIVGGGDVHLGLANNDIELLQPLRLPTLGGALRINQLAMRDYGSDNASGRLDAELEPIKLGQLTGALGWPAFSGTLSGRLPLLQLAENTITVGGNLSAELFDGTMTMSNLRIEQPFGRVPQLYADLALRDLDLQRVTEAFSFGYIQGRLSGDVTGLNLENWRPVAMDMHIYTPANDRSQHRISQRAVENLASVGGGGAAAVLSTGFLKFFDVFSYDRIGLRCRLQNGQCAMSGVGPAKPGPQGTGYYIVRGKGVPRIDVVGYRDTVSWPRLVQQLATITRSGAPTVN